jgi:hypothetical protein
MSSLQMHLNFEVTTQIQETEEKPLTVKNYYL